METYRTSTNAPLESEPQNLHALISWRSIVAGFLITAFTMTGLVGLGLAVGGIGMDADTTAKSVGIFSGVWFLVSAIISLFTGSYFAARVSKFRTSRIGSAQGLVIAALFLGVILWQTIAMIGAVGSAAGNVVAKTGTVVATGAVAASNNNAISNTVNNLTEQAMGDLNLKSDPAAVAQGVGSRLIRGDTVGAKNYLAYQAGITPTEADARIAQMRAQVDKAVADAKEAAATALKSTGWTLFSLVILGAVASLTGGALGSAANLKKPLFRDNELPHGYHA